MSIPPVSQYTYQRDLRAFGNGTPEGYKTALTTLVAGELVAWDSTNKTLVRFVRDGSAGQLAGISKDDLVGIQKLGNQPALIAAYQNPFEVFTTGIHTLLGTAAESYVHDTLVYMSGTDTQKVTTVQGTGGVVVGKVYLPDGSTITGAVQVPIVIDEYTVAVSS